MKPDDKYNEKQMQMETEKLKQKVAALSPQDKQQIYEKGLTHLPQSAWPRAFKGSSMGPSGVQGQSQSESADLAWAKAPMPMCWHQLAVSVSGRDPAGEYE